MNTSARSTDQAIVIGAGLAGLATAIRLQNKGCQVKVFESGNQPGGKAGVLNQAGFSFDTGPSLFTMPQLVEELFTLCGKNPEDFFQYEQLPLICRYFYPDSTEINAWSDPKRFAEELEEKTADKASAVQSFLSYSKNIYDLTAPIFIFNSLHKRATFLNAKAFKTLFRLPQIDPFRTMHQSVARFFKDDRTIQLFDRYATYNGSDPYQAPATLNVIPHLEHQLGAFFPKGGIRSIPQVLHKLAESIGVQFYWQEPVEEIQVEGKEVNGVKTSKATYDASLVVSNADIWPTYRNLLPNQKAPEKTLQQPRSSSALIFYWGMNQTTPNLALHNIFFSGRYQEEFQYLFEKKSIIDDPTVYVYISSKHCPDHAPAGQENWFVMINAPNDSGQDWEELTPKVRASIVKKLNKALGQDIEKHIVCESYLDPRGIAKNTSSYRGALYGSSSNNKYAAFLRHANFSSKIKGLYFCGGSVHPGGGIPLVLASAKIVSEMIPSVKRS